MNDFKQYRRKELAELRSYKQGEILSSEILISEADKENGSPKLGDMIARNPKNHNDQWLVAKQYFEDNFEHTNQGEVTIDVPKIRIRDLEIGKEYEFLSVSDYAIHTAKIEENNISRKYVIFVLYFSDGSFQKFKLPYDIMQNRYEFLKRI